MPNTKSAKKALRVSEKKATFNRIKKNKLQRSLKEFRRSLTSTLENAQSALGRVFSDLDKAAKTNTINKGTANRKKSRLTTQMKKKFDQIEEGAKKATVSAAKAVKETAEKVEKSATKATTAASKKVTKKPAAKKTTKKTPAKKTSAKK